MVNCLFCKIVKKELPCYRVYEDNSCLAFLDIKPHTQGHTIIIPKEHHETVLSLEEEKLESLIQAVKKIMQLLQEKLQPAGFNIGWNHGEQAGQVVPHLHLHILPRYVGDKGGSIHSIVNSPGELSVEEVLKKIQE